MSFFDNFFNKCSCDGHQVYPATITPIMDGVGYVGSSAKYAREDHVHPSDTSKQDTLISGSNIKTVNGESLLGGGDLVVGGGGEKITFTREFFDTGSDHIYHYTSTKTSGEIFAFPSLFAQIEIPPEDNSYPSWTVLLPMQMWLYPQYDYCGFSLPLSNYISNSAIYSRHDAEQADDPLEFDIVYSTK